MRLLSISLALVMMSFCLTGCFGDKAASSASSSKQNIQQEQQKQKPKPKLNPETELKPAAQAFIKAWTGERPDQFPQVMYTKNNNERFWKTLKLQNSFWITTMATNLALDKQMGIEHNVKNGVGDYKLYNDSSGSFSWAIDYDNARQMEVTLKTVKVNGKWLVDGDSVYNEMTRIGLQITPDMVP